MNRDRLVICALIFVLLSLSPLIFAFSDSSSLQITTVPIKVADFCTVPKPLGPANLTAKWTNPVIEEDYVAFQLHARRRSEIHIINLTNNAHVTVYRNRNNIFDFRPEVENYTVVFQRQDNNVLLNFVMIMSAGSDSVFGTADDRKPKRIFQANGVIQGPHIHDSIVTWSFRTATEQKNYYCQTDGTIPNCFLGQYQEILKNTTDKDILFGYDYGGAPAFIWSENDPNSQTQQDIATLIQESKGSVIRTLVNTTRKEFVSDIDKGFYVFTEWDTPTFSQRILFGISPIPQFSVEVTKAKNQTLDRNARLSSLSGFIVWERVDFSSRTPKPEVLVGKIFKQKEVHIPFSGWENNPDIFNDTVIFDDGKRLWVSHCKIQ